MSNMPEIRNTITEAEALAIAKAAYGDTARVKHIPNHSDPSTRYRVAYIPEGSPSPIVIGAAESGFIEALQKSFISDKGQQRIAEREPLDVSEGGAQYSLREDGSIDFVRVWGGVNSHFKLSDSIKPSWISSHPSCVPRSYPIEGEIEYENQIKIPVTAQVNVQVNAAPKVAIPKGFVNPNAIKTGLMGWDDEVTPAAVLAAITGEHLLVVGPPGAAKSLFTRRFFANFEGGLFETQLSKYADETSLFGAPNLKKLRDEGIFEYPRHGIAANEWGFIDEIFDASDVLLRTLLGILQEKKFTKSGREEDIPLQSVIATANYTRVNDITSAVVDRFAFAVSSPVLTDAQRARLYSNETFEEVKTASNKVSLEQIKQMRAKAKEVTIPDSIVTALVNWSSEMKFTPRRERKLASIIRASASLHGRTKVDENDIMAARFCVPISNSGKVEDARKSLQPLKDAILQSLHEGEQLAQLGKLAQIPQCADTNNPTAVVNSIKAVKENLRKLREFNCVSEKVNQKREVAVNQHDQMISVLTAALGV